MTYHKKLIGIWSFVRILLQTQGHKVLEVAGPFERFLQVRDTFGCYQKKCLRPAGSHHHHHHQQFS